MGSEETLPSTWPRYAQFQLRRACASRTAKRFSLLDGILAFWRATDGPGKRKAFLPPRKVKRPRGKAWDAFFSQMQFTFHPCFHSRMIAFFHLLIFESLSSSDLSLCLPQLTLLEDIIEIVRLLLNSAMKRSFVSNAFSLIALKGSDSHCNHAGCGG